jgi:hypothetical protein
MIWRLGRKPPETKSTHFAFAEFPAPTIDHEAVSPRRAGASRVKS